MEMPGNIEKELDEGLQDLVMLWPEKKDESVFFFICRSPPLYSLLSLYSSSNFDSKGPLIFIQTPLALKGIDIASRVFLFFLIFCLYVDALHDSLDKLRLFLKKLFLKWLPKLRLFVDLFFNKISDFFFRSKMCLIDLLLLHPHSITMIKFHLNLRLSKTLSYLNLVIITMHNSDCLKNSLIFFLKQSNEKVLLLGRVSSEFHFILR